MTGILVGGLIIAAVLVIWVVLQSTQAQRTQGVETQMSELRRDLQALISVQSQNAGQLSAIGQTVAQRLDSVTKTLQDGVTQSAQIAANSQTQMTEQLKSSQQALGEI